MIELFFFLVFVYVCGIALFLGLVYLVFEIVFFFYQKWQRKRIKNEQNKLLKRVLPY